MIFLYMTVYIEGISSHAYMAPDKCTFETVVVMICPSSGCVVVVVIVGCVISAET